MAAFAPQGETQKVSIKLNFTGFGSLRLPRVVEVAELVAELLFAMVPHCLSEGYKGL